MIDHGTATIENFRQAGIGALVRALGLVGMIRFLQRFETGRGDYTAERQRQYEPGTPATVAALAAEIMREQQAGRVGPVRPGSASGDR